MRVKHRTYPGLIQKPLERAASALVFAGFLDVEGAHVVVQASVLRKSSASAYRKVRSVSQARERPVAYQGVLPREDASALRAIHRPEGRPPRRGALHRRRTEGLVAPGRLGADVGLAHGDPLLAAGVLALLRRGGDEGVRHVYGL